MTRDDVELLVMRQLDNDLSDAERAALDAELGANPEAQSLVAQHQKLDAILKSEVDLPPINWDELADRISESITAEQDRSRMRISPQFAWRGLMGLAVAACVVLAALVWVKVASNPTGTGPTVAVNPTSSTPGHTEVAVLSEPPMGPAVTEIKIGPSPSLAAQSASLPVSEEIIPRATSLAIDSAAFPSQDSTPFQ